LDEYSSWPNYCRAMSHDGYWGDHLVLIGAAEVFQCNIEILSSVDSNDPITKIEPKLQKPKKSIYLVHYHEMHYNSLHPSSKL